MAMKKIQLFFLIIISLNIYSKGLILDWAACYGSGGNDYPQAVEVLPDGNILVGVNGASIDNPELLNNYHGSIHATNYTREI